MRRPVCSLACLALAATAVLHSQLPAPRPPELPEARAERAYQVAFQQGPLELRSYLAGFPKGADLHVHLSGAVYAESFIRAAGEDGLCVDPAALSFAKPPCTAPLVPAVQLSGNITPANQDL